MSEMTTDNYVNQFILLAILFKSLRGLTPKGFYYGFKTF